MIPEVEKGIYSAFVKDVTLINLMCVQTKHTIKLVWPL